ncbi:MAG: hypothetical protein JST54_13430 [Deltaproteobacteria bacterium]|nr:hypothetical protein [Deltaproteobacteria bacterium]
MSVMNILLAIDGRPEVLKYLAEMGLALPEGFRSKHPPLAHVKTALGRMRGWRLGEPDHPTQKKFWCDLYQGDLCISTLMFALDDAGDAVLGGTRGDLAMPLLQELAREQGPLVILFNAEKPMLVEAPQA